MGGLAARAKHEATHVDAAADRSRTGVRFPPPPLTPLPRGTEEVHQPSVTSRLFLVSCPACSYAFHRKLPPHWGQLWGQLGNPELELPPHAADPCRPSLCKAAGRSLQDVRRRRGLYLEVSPAGGKWWRWKYRSGGKEKRLSLGVYPDVSLKSAREKRDSARQQLAAGIDPGQARKAEKFAQAGAESFEAIAREWHAKFSPGWVASHGDRILRRFERDLFPWLGKRPIAKIKAPELLAVLRRIDSRGA